MIFISPITLQNIESLKFELFDTLKILEILIYIILNF